MKKIATQLTIYFVATLLLLSILIGLFFSFSYRRYVFNYNKDVLQKKAESIASSISNNTSGDGRSAGKPKNDFVTYIKWLNETEDSDVWLVTYSETTDKLVIIAGSNDPWSDKEANTLPNNAYSVISSAMSGTTTVSKNFSSALGTKSITIGTPVFNNSQVMGVILIHSPISNMRSISSAATLLFLLCLIVALVCAILISIKFSVHFTKPLRRMKDVSVQLAERDYSVKTGIKRQDEIGQLASSIDELSTRLEIADKEQAELENMRREYVANVSHELRTPITVIRSSLEALNDGIITDPNEIRDYYENLLGESKVMQTMVNDLLELSRLQNAHFDIKHDVLSLTELVDDAVRCGKKLGKDKNIEIRADFPNSPCLFVGDYGRIRQLLLILFDNAIKFSQENSQILVTLTEDERYRILVKDFGSGISPEDLPHIFDRFKKSSSSQNKNGTGLGLAIAKETVSRHHGAITVSSTLGQGTAFEIILPKNYSENKKEAD